MFQKANRDDYGKLMGFLKNEPVLNTFIIADIDIYGFDKEFQTIYMDVDHEGECTAVALIFHSNLILASLVEDIDYSFLLGLLDGSINNIMGEAKVVEAFSNKITAQAKYIRKQMYILEDTQQLVDLHQIRMATTEDVDKIHNFLMSHEEIKHLYQNKDMITNRIESGEGVHMILEHDGSIIGHANSAASTELSAMIGGVAVAHEHRNKSVAKSLVSQVCKYIMIEGKTPCLFAGEELENNLYITLGFKPYKKWGTLGI